MKVRLKLTVIIVLMNYILTPFSYIFANEDENFDVTENIVTETEEDTSETEEDTSETEENIPETEENTSKTKEDISETEEDIPETRENTSEAEENTSETKEDNQTNSADSFQDSKDITSDTQGNENQQDYTGNTSTIFPEGETGDKIESPESQSGSEVSSGNNVIDQEVKEEKNENEGIIEEIGEEIGEEIQEIVTKIRYFFKKGGDSRYIKYGRDSNNIGTITLKDPKNGASITIMDKNLGANSMGDNGYYFQWGNNSGVKTVNSSNKTTEKAVYKDSYYSRGYDGEGKFIIGGTDYWENGAHYNNLWGNESKESSRYGACPVGYHIPTVKEWNQLLSIWGKIHTQDTSTSEIVLRYSANYATKNIHTFKGAATQCEGGESECVDEDKLSIIIDTLSDELKLPLAGSYDENGNFHDGLGVYWTSISKDGNKAGVFDMNAYIGNGEDDTLMYKAQGHNIRCFQNVELYEEYIQPENEIEEIDVQDSSLVSISFSGNQNNGNNNSESQTGSLEDFVFLPQNNDGEGDVQDSSQENVELQEGSEDKCPEHYHKNGDICEIDTYMITRKNEDGSVRDTTTVEYGQIPTHEDAYQPADAHYTYTFAGWEPEIKPVEGDEEYKAKYIYNENKYIVTWKNEDGTMIDTTQVQYGQIPTHEDAYQPADTHYSYEFLGWEPEIKPVEGDAEYRAKYKYTVNRYTVTWKDEDGTILKTQEVEYGTTPIYSESTPIKESTEEFEYKFAGWEPVIEEIKGDTVYTAKYIETPIIQNEESKDGEAETDSLEQDSENDKQDAQEIVSELQNNENIQSGTHGNENEGSFGGSSSTNEDISTNTSGGENSMQEGKKSEKDQGLFGGLWETLKSFFLADEGGYLIGSETIDNIVVNVEAEKGTFPNGTEVVIKGVSQDRLETIQISLIEDETNNVTEDAQILAFDISFVYSGEEIQPEKEVSVKFNYKDNSDFQGSSMSELSVYHIDDETDEGEEVEVVNKEGDEIEILATSFSTYALVLTINPSIILHLDAVGGDLSNNTGVTITDTPNVGDGEITADQNGYVTLPTNVTKTGYTFAGWYEDAQYTSPVLLDGSGKYQVDGNTPTLYAKRINGGGAYGVTYVFADDVTFDGTNYINTDLKLFSSSFGKKDFDINFNVDSITAFNPGQNQGRNNIMHIINEKGNPYQGFDLRLENDANSYKGQIRAVSQKDNFTLGNSTSTSSSFRFWTENNVLHYYDNGVDVTSQDFSSTVSFDYPLMFGAALNSSMAGQRYMKGTLSDITVYVAYDNGSSITLPEPTRTNKFFNGWYENAQCTIPVQLNENGKYAVGMNKALYVDWADYKVTIESNESSYGGVDISEVKVKSGAIVVDNGDNTLTIINTSGKTTTITAIPTPSQYDLFSFVEWNISGCTNTITNNCTIVANFTGDKHFVTFDSNRGTFDIFENMTKSSNPQLVDDGGIVEQPADPELPGYEFLGWFNGNEEWDFDNDTVSENITLTAKRSYLLEYGELDVYTISSSGTKKAFALMDRNVGATGLYNKNFDSPNFESFGYAYQWGNNYGFNKVEGNGNSYNQEYISGNAVAHDVWSSHLASQFANKTWITVNPWNDGATKNDYLWGRVTDPYEAMQGPCPDGYHVPTQNEFSNELYNNWSDVYGNGTRFKSAEQQYFTKDLLFPMAGSRSNGSIVDDRQGICAEYWEAGPSNVVERATDLWFCKDNEVQNYKGTFSMDSASYRYNGLSVRCFKNDTNNATVDFSMNGGTKALVSVQKINGVNTIISTKDPVKDGMEFGGRYSSSNFEGNTRKTEGSIISGGNVTLYAKWNCPTGQALNGQGQCISGVTVTFHDEDGALLESVSVLSGNSATYPNVDPIKDGGYEFDGWVLSDRETFADLTNVIEDMDVYAHFHGGCPEDYEWNGSECVLKSYTITFVDWDGSIITSGTYHSGDNINVPANPTKEADEIYTYNFSGWDPTVAIVTGDMAYTATYTSQINKYTVTIGVLPVDYGTVSSESVTADYGIPITTSDNALTIGSTTIIATPATSGAQYTYTFSGWSFNNCGSGGEEEIRSNCEITANFDREVNRYDVTFDSDGGDYTPDVQSIEYGSIAMKPTPDPIRTGYEFSGWMLDGVDFDFSTPITGSTNLVAKWNLVEYTITYNLDGGTNSDNNPDIYTIESGAITLQQPTKTGYTFLGWTGSNGDIPQTGVVIPTGSYGNREYNAVWKANTTQYTVYHYVKEVGENTYALSKTDILTGTTDEMLVLSSLAKENEFPCAHYSSGSLTGTENGPGNIVTQTTIKGDGSTKIYLYYTRNSYTVTLRGDTGVKMLKINGNETNQVTIECGSEVPVEAVPKPGYHFVMWYKEEKEEDKYYGEVIPGE